MPSLTDVQLEGLSSPQLSYDGTELNNYDPYPEGSCWGWALFGGYSSSYNPKSPPSISNEAFAYDEQDGSLTGIKSGFKNWVEETSEPDRCQ